MKDLPPGHGFSTSWVPLLQNSTDQDQVPHPILPVLEVLGAWLAFIDQELGLVRSTQANLNKLPTGLRNVARLSMDTRSSALEKERKELVDLAREFIVAARTPGFGRDHLRTYHRRFNEIHTQRAVGVPTPADWWIAPILEALSAAWPRD